MAASCPADPQGRHLHPRRRRRSPRTSQPARSSRSIPKNPASRPSTVSSTRTSGTGSWNLVGHAVQDWDSARPGLAGTPTRNAGDTVAFVFKNEPGARVGEPTPKFTGAVRRSCRSATAATAACSPRPTSPGRSRARSPSTRHRNGGRPAALSRSRRQGAAQGAQRNGRRRQGPRPRSTRERGRGRGAGAPVLVPCRSGRATCSDRSRPVPAKTERQVASRVGASCAYAGPSSTSAGGAATSSRSRSSTMLSTPPR